MQGYKCVLTFVVSTTALLTVSAFGQTSYTNLSLKGNYVFSESAGAGAGALASAGVLVADGNGNVAGTLIEHMQGTAASLASVAGQYIVNSDGTATMTLNLNVTAPDPDSDITPLQMIRQYDMVFTSKGLLGAASGAGGYSTVEMQPQPAANGNTVPALKGSYAFQESGVVNNNTARISVGQFSLDGTGGVRGVMQVRTAGSAQVAINFTGTYAVNADGTGNITILYADTSVNEDDAHIDQSQFGFVVGPSSLIGVRLDSGAYAISEFVRQ